MPRREKIEEWRMQAVAYLASQGYSRKEIESNLRLSQPTISRSLKVAEKEGWFSVYFNFNREKIPHERMQEIEARLAPEQQRALQAQVREFTRKHGGLVVPNVRVFPSANRDIDRGAWASRLERFGQVAAAHIGNLLRQSNVCGIPWGSTVASVVRGLRQLGLPPLRKEAPISFIPLCGEPLGMAVTERSASHLAAQFNEIINGGTGQLFSLAAVPALIPMGFTPEEVQVIRKLMRHVEAYRTIFEQGDEEEGQSTPWVDRLDTVLTGVGTAQRPLGLWHDAIVRTGEVDRDRLNQLVVGDICGVLFPRQDLCVADMEELKKIKERWLGIREHQMKRCADRTFRHKLDNDLDQPPGVIVVAIGKIKATSVCESVKHGLVNELVVDEDLAEALGDEMAAPQ